MQIICHDRKVLHFLKQYETQTAPLYLSAAHTIYSMLQTLTPALTSEEWRESQYLLITPAGSVSDTSEPSKSTSTSANPNHLLAQFLKVSGYSFSFVFLFSPLMDQHWSQTWYAHTIVSICVHCVCKFKPSESESASTIRAWMTSQASLPYPLLWWELHSYCVPLQLIMFSNDSTKR